VLAALHPGRIDLGVGRSLGFTAPVRRALREPGDFREDLDELRAYLVGEAAVTARPRLDEPVPLFVLATGKGLAIAGDLGLPVVVGGPVLDDAAALADYRARGGPELIVSVDVLVGDPSLALPEAWAMAASRATGEFPPLEPPNPARPMTDRQRTTVENALARTIVGDADSVGARVRELADRTGADELLLTSSTWDREALARSDAALATLASRDLATGESGSGDGRVGRSHPDSP
jgi:alkanesulfonate monooxygenase SsuD/methylene tetrahydromethanopterin reductase-like flavin-dependent oxidoreductase (luciferase family)